MEVIQIFHLDVIARSLSKQKKGITGLLWKTRQNQGQKALRKGALFSSPTSLIFDSF